MCLKHEVPGPTPFAFFLPTLFFFLQTLTGTYYVPPYPLCAIYYKKFPNLKTEICHAQFYQVLSTVKIPLNCISSPPTFCAWSNSSSIIWITPKLYTHLLLSIPIPQYCLLKSQSGITPLFKKFSEPPPTVYRMTFKHCTQGSSQTGPNQLLVSSCAAILSLYTIIKVKY